MKTKCPYCGYVANHHETIDELKSPKDRDISFCIKCGEVSIFSKGNLIKVDVNSFDRETQEEIRGITDAWLQTKNLTKFQKKTKR